VTGLENFRDTKRVNRSTEARTEDSVLDTPTAMLAKPTPLQQDVFNRLSLKIAP
jgi:hypothetical protein